MRLAPIEAEIQTRIDALTLESPISELLSIAVDSRASSSSFDRANFFRVLQVIAKDLTDERDKKAALAAMKAMSYVSPRRYGHGPSNLVAGSMWEGFFGIVPASEFFLGDDLAADLGVDEGELQNSESDWMKFAWRGQIVFIPKMTFMHSVSWDHLYSRGIVYGTDDNGTFPRGTPTNQYTTVTKDRTDYICQLLTGAASDPIDTSLRAEQDSSFLGLGMGSMYNGLIYRMHEYIPSNDDFDTFHGGSQIGGNWMSLNNSELNITGNGRYKWTQETSNEAQSARVFRGSGRVSGFNRHAGSNATTDNGWFPCLVVKS